MMGLYFCLYCPKLHSVNPDLYHEVKGDLPNDNATNRESATYYYWVCSCGDTSMMTIKEAMSEKDAKDDWMVHRIDKCRAPDACMEIKQRTAMLLVIGGDTE